MPKQIYNAALLIFSLVLGSKAYCYDYGSNSGSSSCPPVQSNTYQGCNNCCCVSGILYCSCTVLALEPAQCQNSQLDLSQCDLSQPITINQYGYLQCTDANNGGTYTADEAHEWGQHPCPITPEACGGPSLRAKPQKPKAH